MKVLFVNSNQYATTNHVLAEVNALEEWAKYLEVEYDIIDSADPLILDVSLRYASAAKVAVVALGGTSSKRVTALCKKRGYDMEVLHMMHPSPKNRLVADKRTVYRMLNYTKRVLRGSKSQLQG